MSYASTSPSLSDKMRFPRFYRVMTPGSAVNDVRVKLFHEFGWYKISTIHEAYGLFSSVTDSMLEKLKLTNISVIRSEIFKGDPTIQLHNLKKHDARIIVAGFYEDKAMVVFCEVYKIGLYGPRIVWMLPDWFDSDWWLQRENPTSCTREQLSTALDGYFATGLFYLNPRNVRTVSGIHPQEYYREFKRRANYTKLPGEILSPLSYDAMWGIALALNETIKSLEEIGSAKRLEDFTYEDKEIADLIFNCVRKVRFQGVKGSISFDEDGAAGIVRIQRVQDNELKLVGMFDTGMDNASFEWSSKTPLKWADVIMYISDA